VSSYIKYGGEFGPAVSERFDRQGARDRRTRGHYAIRVVDVFVILLLRSRQVIHWHA
jgi:hypothetical protein